MGVKIETEEQFVEAVEEITNHHLDSIAAPLPLMIDMLGPKGFNRMDIVAILEALQEEIGVAQRRINRLRGVAPETAS